MNVLESDANPITYLPPAIEVIEVELEKPILLTASDGWMEDGGGAGFE